MLTSDVEPVLEANNWKNFVFWTNTDQQSVDNKPEEALI